MPSSIIFVSDLSIRMLLSAGAIFAGKLAHDDKHDQDR